MNLNAVQGRVRVAVRLRPRNEEEKEADADFADCVEVQPEVENALAYACCYNLLFICLCGCYFLVSSFYDLILSV